MFQKFAEFTGCLVLAGLVAASPVAAQSMPSAENDDPSRSPNSYIGLGGALGLNGNTSALGTGGVAILSKVRFTDNFSLHDATILFGGGAATSMIILSADLPIRNAAGQTIAAPFIGAGAMLRYDNGLSISPAISGGIDIPLAQKFTGTVRVNAGFPNDQQTDVGVLVGVGYSFGN